MVGSYMLLLCLYSSRLIIASAHKDPCLTPITKFFLVIYGNNASLFYSVFLKCLFHIEYSVF